MHLPFVIGELKRLRAMLPHQVLRLRSAFTVLQPVVICFKSGEESHRVSAFEDTVAHATTAAGLVV